MRVNVVALWVLAAAAPAAADGDLDRWHRSADLVVRAEVVQVSGDGDAVTVVIDRALRGERPPLALTFAPAPEPRREPPTAKSGTAGAGPPGGGPTPGTGWRVGDRVVLFLRHRLDPNDGPRWDSIAPRGALPDAADPLAASALDRYFGAEPAADRAVREARAIQALDGASPALARHGSRLLEALAREGPLEPATRLAIGAAGRDRNPVRRLGAVAPLRGLACKGDGAAAEQLNRLAEDADVEVASLARRARATRCGEPLETAEEGGTNPLAVAAGVLVAVGLLAGGLIRKRSRGTDTGLTR